MKKSEYTDHLPLRSLVINPRAQRALSRVMVNKLKAIWRLDAVGVITVSIRDGRAFIVNGQHRVAAGMELGLGDTKVLCHVYRGLTEEEEARKFLELNDVKIIKPMDRYNVGLTAKDPVYLGLRDTLAKHGLVVSQNEGVGRVRCIGEVKKLYEADPALLDLVCQILSDAWGVRSSAFDRMVVAGLGLVLQLHDGKIDPKTMSGKLAHYSGGAAALAGDAKGARDIGRAGSVQHAAADIMLIAYNRGRHRSSRLELMS